MMMQGRVWTVAWMCFLCACITGGNAAAAVDTNLLKVVLPFQTCVRVSTEQFLVNERRRKNVPSSELEGQAWNAALDECGHLVGDAAKMAMLRHFEGDPNRALGFWKGVVYSARAYVIARVSDVADAGQ